MERLTIRIESQNRVIMSDFMPVNVCDGCTYKQNCSKCSFYKLLDKLAAYEDLGTVEELAELVKAKQDGRLLIDPIGDESRYVIESVWGECPMDNGGECIDDNMDDCAECRMSRFTKQVREYKPTTFKEEKKAIEQYFEALGITVFLTREEAEAKLKEVQA